MITAALVWAGFAMVLPIVNDTEPKFRSLKV